MSNHFHGSYLSTDVHFLLKPIDIVDTSIAEKERLVQSGRAHYSEMISAEYRPSPAYLEVFDAAMQRHKQRIGVYLLRLAKHIHDTAVARQVPITLVSLARAGTPIGVLLKRILQQYWQIEVHHYSISIIRDRGIDDNALNYILKHHASASVFFIDGWTGKGVIARELFKWVSQFNQRYHSQLNSDLYVLADVAGHAEVTATTDDFLLPSALLNATVSGLISRSILNPSYIGKNDFHGCKFYRDWLSEDRSLWLVDEIMASLPQAESVADQLASIAACQLLGSRLQTRYTAQAYLHDLMTEFQVAHINHIKPGIGEAIRVLLRRLPEVMLVRNMDTEDIKPFVVLAKEKQITLVTRPDLPYQAVGIIARATGK